MEQDNGNIERLLALEAKCAAQTRGENGFPPGSSSSSNDDDHNYNHHLVVWREKVVQWFYRVVDHVNEDRSTVYVATNILDLYFRISSNSNALVNEKTYELAAIVSLFLAWKLRSNSSTNVGGLRLETLITLSFHNRGEVHQICEAAVSMKKDIVEKLSLKQQHELIVIAPVDFVTLYIQQFLPTARRRQRQQSEILETAVHLVELAVFDSALSSLSGCKASQIALAAVLIALDLAEKDGRSHDGGYPFHSKVPISILLAASTHRIDWIRNRLQLLRYQQQQQQQEHLTSTLNAVEPAVACNNDENDDEDTMPHLIPAVTEEDEDDYADDTTTTTATAAAVNTCLR